MIEAFEGGDYRQSGSNHALVDSNACRKMVISCVTNPSIAGSDVECPSVEKTALLFL